MWYNYAYDAWGNVTVTTHTNGIEATVDLMRNTGKKSAKRAFKKTAKKAGKHFVKEYFHSQVERCSISITGEGVSFMIDGTIKSWQ